jgi:hypothetical protein
VDWTGPDRPGETRMDTAAAPRTPPGSASRAVVRSLRGQAPRRAIGRVLRRVRVVDRERDHSVSVRLSRACMMATSTDVIDRPEIMLPVRAYGHGSPSARATALSVGATDIRRRSGLSRETRTLRLIPGIRGLFAPRASRQPGRSERPRAPSRRRSQFVARPNYWIHRRKEECAACVTGPAPLCRVAWNAIAEARQLLSTDAGAWRAPTTLRRTTGPRPDQARHG